MDVLGRMKNVTLQEQIILDLSNLRNKLLITELILDYWEILDSTGNPGVLTIVCVPFQI